MRKQIRTNKIAKRTLAMLLAMTMVFGLTFTVYAEEEGSEASGGAQTAQASPSESSEPVSAASDAIDAAIEVVAPQGEVQVVELQPVADGLNDAQTAVDALVKEDEAGNEVTDLQVADAANTVAEEELAKIDADQLAADTQDAKDAQGALGDYFEAATVTGQDADSVIVNADLANSTNSKKEAYNAKDQAKSDLANAETGLKEATEAYKDASAKLDNAQADYDAAKDASDKAAKKVEEAKEALENAETNTAAALAALAGAKAVADELEKKTQQYADTVDELKAIEKQYHAIMVRYYRDLGYAKYDENGILDVNASAQALLNDGTTGTTKADNKALGPGNPFMEMSRYLMEQLITYMITENGGEITSFATGGDGNANEKKPQGKTASEGILYMNGGKEDVTTKAASPQQIWTNVDGDNGRNNHLRVTYIDKDENEQTAYFNYVIKNNAKYKDELDVANGPIYLAYVQQDENGKWSNSAVEDGNNFDDYSKLTKAIEAIQDLEAYKAAKDAVDEAEKKVQALQAEIDTLKGTVNDNDKDLKAKNEELEKLEGALADASEAYAVAKEDVKALEDKVEEARKAVAGIDLSRFRVTNPADDEGTPAAPVISSITPAVEVTPVLPQIIPVATIGSTPALTTLLAAVDGEDAVEAAPAVEEGTPVILEDEVLPAAAVADADGIQTMEDEELPAAQGAEKASFWWLWILLLILALIVAYMIYRYNEKKKEENNTAA